MNNKKVADVLVDTLVAAGVKNIYGLAGDSLNGITDSIRTRDNIKWIPCGTRKPPRLRRERKRISPGISRFAPEAAGRAICI